MNEIVNNKVNLCDSCSQTYPGCTSKPENVYFGDGIGHDNICACSEYQPETHEERTETHACDCVSGVAAIIAAIEAVDEWDGGYNVQRANMIRDAIKALPSAQPQWISVTKEEMFKAGYEGREIRFRVDGRLFAIRELAQ